MSGSDLVFRINLEGKKLYSMKSYSTPCEIQPEKDGSTVIRVGLTEEKWQALQSLAQREGTQTGQMAFDILLNHVQEKSREPGQLVSGSLVGLTVGESTSQYGAVGGHSRRGFFASPLVGLPLLGGLLLSHLLMLLIILRLDRHSPRRVTVFSLNQPAFEDGKKAPLYPRKLLKLYASHTTSPPACPQLPSRRSRHPDG